MTKYVETQHTIEVPKNTGMEGFLHTIRELLKLDKIKEITINSKGEVSYRRMVPEEITQDPIMIDYEGLQPSSIIRMGSLAEMVNDGELPHILVSNMFSQLDIERLSPVCWASGAATVLSKWYAGSGVKLPAIDNFYGLPLHLDRALPDSVLILCASSTDSPALVDCHRFLKVDMEEPIPELPKTTVDIML